MRLLSIAFVLIASITFAQPPHAKGGKGKDKEKHEHKDKDHKHDKEDKKDKSDKHNHKKDHPGKGNAYGKNKGDLSGREFGQQRAADAKSKVKKSCKHGDEKVVELENRIEKAKDKVEKEKEDGIITAEIAIEKGEKIKKAEQKLKELKDEIEKERRIKITLP